jgi:hypothetical protein
VPGPAIEPTVIPADERPEMSTIPPGFVLRLAWPPVLVSKKNVNPPELVVMVALPAVLVLRKFVVPPFLLMMVALPAELVSEKFVVPYNWSLVMLALPAVLVFTKFEPLPARQVKTIHRLDIVG